MACEGNMPSFKYVTVKNLVIIYNGKPHPIKTFVTNKKYIVWNIDRPYQLEDTNVRPESSLLEYLIVINDNGKPTIVEHDELLYSFDAKTNGSNLESSGEYNALKSEVSKNTSKFNLISNNVDSMMQTIGKTEELTDGTIIYNLNKVKADSESYGIDIREIKTKIDDKYAEIKPIILNNLVEYLRSVSEYKLSFTNILEDTLITEEELALINTNKTNIINKLTQLQTTLDNLKTIIDSVNDAEKSQLIINIKTQLTTLHDGLISMCDSYLLDNKISGEEKTNIIQKSYELTTYIGTVQNTCNNITINGQGGVIYSVENELLLFKDKTTSKITEVQRNADATYATQSSLSQTSTDIMAKFSASGGYNKLYNSAFLTGNLDSWIIQGDCTADVGTSSSSGFANRLRVIATGINQGVRQEVIGLRAGVPHTLSCLMNSDGNGKAGIQVLENGVYLSKYNSGTVNGWETVSITFIPTTTSASIRLGTLGNGLVGTYYFTAAILSEGELPVQWSPNHSEIYEGITTINKDGITISMIDGEGSQGYSKISYEGIATYDSDGNTKSWFGANDSAYIKELNVDIINNPYIIQCRPRSTNWYVGQNETGDGTGRDTSNKANSVQSVLDYVKDNFGCYLNKQNLIINLDNMNLNENIVITGWLGSGNIILNMGKSTTFNGYIRVEENVPYVFLDGESTDFNTNDGCKWYREDGNIMDVALFVRSSNVCCKNFKVHRGTDLNGYGNNFAYIDMASNFQMTNMDIVKYNTIIRGAGGSSIYIGECRGDVAYISASLSRCTLVCKNNMPIFAAGANIVSSGSIVDTDGWKLDTNSLWMPKVIATPEVPEPVQPSPPSKSWNWVEKTFYFKLSSNTEGSGSATSGWSDKWGQGKWGSYKPHRGHAIPTQSISDWCKVGSTTRNISMTLTMTRLNTNHGYGGAVPTPKIKQKDGSYWNSGVAFARGDTKSISLSSGIVSGLSDGTLSELTMWTGASTSDYSQYNTVKLKVKCEKYY